MKTPAAITWAAGGCNFHTAVARQWDVDRHYCSVARLLSKKNPHQNKQGFDDCVAKGHCKGEDSGGECAPYCTKLQKTPFSN